MRRAKEADPDMLVILVNLPSCPFVYRALEELQWAPRSVWTLFCMVTDTYLKEVIKPALQQDVSVTFLKLISLFVGLALHTSTLH